SRADSLYVGSAGDNTVKRYDSTTGAYQGAFVSRDSGGPPLYGPRDLIFNQSGDLLVSNQNVNRPIPGDILVFNGATGIFVEPLVPPNQKAPFAPDGIVLYQNNLYVANQTRGFSPDGSPTSGPGA